MWNNSLSRRRFLKQSGTAGIATILAWHGLGTKSWAETQGGGTGGSSGGTWDLISVEILMVSPVHYTFPGDFVDSDAAMVAVREYVANKLKNNLRRNEVWGDVTGKTPCCEVIPNSGPVIPLVEIIKKPNGKFTYKVDIEGETWVPITFWK